MPVIMLTGKSKNVKICYMFLYPATHSGRENTCFANKRVITYTDLNFGSIVFSQHVLNNNEILAKFN